MCRFFSEVKERLVITNHAERGLLIGGVLGAIYVGIRAGFSSINIPLIGDDSGFAIGARVLFGLLTGRYYGHSIGNRLGEVTDIWCGHPPTPEHHNRIFLAKILPFMFALLADLAVWLWKDFGGKPIFNFLCLTSTEIYIFATLYGAYIGATMATREGRFFDILTGNHLIADLYLTRLLAWIKEKCCTRAEPAALETTPLVP